MEEGGAKNGHPLKSELDAEVWVGLGPPLLGGRSRGWGDVWRDMETLFVRKETLNLLQALPLGLRDEEQGKYDGGKADARVEPECPMATHGRTHHGWEGLDHQEHLQVG